MATIDDEMWMLARHAVAPGLYAHEQDLPLHLQSLKVFLYIIRIIISTRVHILQQYMVSSSLLFITIVP